MASAFKDFYKTLDIAFTASETEIKSAYRKMARLFHPDLHPEDVQGYTAKFQEITEAHETLSDVNKKAAYDNQYRYHVLGQQAYYVPQPEDFETAYYNTYEPPVKNKRQSYVPYGAFLVLLMYVFRMVTNVSSTSGPATYQPNSYVSPSIQQWVDSLSHAKDTVAPASIFQKKNDSTIPTF